MSPITLPLHLQVRQTSDVESSVAIPVRVLSTRKYIRAPLYPLEREAESFSNTSASLITAGVCETDSPHPERTEGITHQGVCCLGCESFPLGALTDPVPGVALATLPVDVMKATPYDGGAGSCLDPNQLDTLTQDKASHYMPISDFH
jgi:hypothetical protein